MSTSLAPGANAPLAPAATYAVRLRVDSGRADLVALLLDEHDRVATRPGDEGVVLFSNPQAGGGAIRLDESSGEISIEPGRLPGGVVRVLLVGQVDGAPDLSGSGGLHLSVAVDGTEAATVDLPASPVPTLQLAEIYLRASAWKVRALGDGYAAGLERLLTVHGVEVEQEPAAAVPAPPQPAPSPAPQPAPTPQPAPAPQPTPAPTPEPAPAPAAASPPPWSPGRPGGGGGAEPWAPQPLEAGDPLGQGVAPPAPPAPTHDLVSGDPLRR